MVTDKSNRVRRLTEELGAAREELDRYKRLLLSIQKSILPSHLPNVPGLDLAVYFADVDSVGGDYYDVRPVGPNCWAIVVADVSGHGLAAGAVLALLHALGNAFQEQTSPLAPGSALSLINKPLATRYLANTGRFVTAFVGLYDAQTQMLTYASAGHPSPRLVRGHEVQRLDRVRGIPLGIEKSAAYENETVQLLEGDRLVLFTDGITESANSAHDHFGDERLDALLQAPASTAAEQLNRVVDSVQTFRGELAASDDETCLVAFVKPIGATKQDGSEVVRC